MFLVRSLACVAGALSNAGRLAVAGCALDPVVARFLAIFDTVFAPVSFVILPLAGVVFGSLMYRVNRRATEGAAGKEASRRHYPNGRRALAPRDSDASLTRAQCAARRRVMERHESRHTPLTPVPSSPWLPRQRGYDYGRRFDAAKADERHGEEHR